MKIELMRSLLFVAVILVYPATLVAQNSEPTKTQPPSEESSSPIKPGAFESLLVPTKDNEASDNSQRQSGDPTAPSAKLLELVPPSVQPTLPVPTASKAKVVSVTPLPTIPKITLRGIVMSKPDRGTAMLDVDGKILSLTLLPPEQQKLIPIPKMQFASLQAALDQRATATQRIGSRSESDAADKTYEMCLQCSFVSGEIVFNLEAFTKEVILLRAIPHDTIVIVRRGR
ncbi:MAG: hypothetical protein VXZ82_16405 [Planctomycetota bacterium]|nr:hypothetical protein [Planctomycetota bacterium]